ncbi:MFS transporter small subunit [Kribbella sp.]
MNQTPRLVVSWLLVAALLGYGIVQTLITAAKLFTN